MTQAQNDFMITVEIEYIYNIRIDKLLATYMLTNYISKGVLFNEKSAII